MRALLLATGVLGLSSVAAAGGFTPPTATTAPPAPPQALAITQQPEPVTTWGWRMVELRVAASGPGPISYQWLRNGEPVGGAYMYGAQSATLLMNPAPPTARGEYVVRVSSGGQTVTSDPVLVDLGCYPDCNQDGMLNLADFGCYQTRFAIGDQYADCNGCGLLNLADFGCFASSFALGC